MQDDEGTRTARTESASGGVSQYVVFCLHAMDKFPFIHACTQCQHARVPASDISSVWQTPIEMYLELLCFVDFFTATLCRRSI